MQNLFSSFMMVLCILLLSGCHPSPPPPPVVKMHFPPVPTNVPLPGRLSREQRTTLLLEGLHKRIRGRLASLPDIERVVKEIAPLVEAAAEQTEVQPIFAQIAEDEGNTPEEAKAHWIALQE